MPIWKRVGRNKHAENYLLTLSTEYNKAYSFALN